MIDFVKLQHRHPKIDEFIEMHEEDVYEQVHKPTGERLPSIRFKKGRYQTTVKRNINQKHGYVFLEGSLHKSYFNGANYERFQYNMLQEEVANLQKTFGVRPELLHIQNIEIGANIETSYSPIDYLRKNILLYKTKSFIQYLPGTDGKVIGFHCPGQPTVKMYDKGYQYDLHHNLMRIEVKHKKSTIIQKLGVDTLADLLDRYKLSRLGKHLIETFERVLLYEPDVDSSKLSTYELNLHQEAEHIRNWERWKSKYSESGYERRRTCYKQICENHTNNEFGKLMAALKEEVYRCVHLPTALCNRVGFFTSSLSSQKSHSPLLDCLPLFPAESLPPLSSTDSLHGNGTSLRLPGMSPSCLPPAPDSSLLPQTPTFPCSDIPP